MTVRDMFIGNIAFTATESEVEAFLSAQGFDVHELRFRTDRDTGRFRGFAFARLAVDGGPADFEEARKRCDGAEFAGRRLNVALSQRERDRQARQGVAVGA